MLKLLNVPIALSCAENTQSKLGVDHSDEQLPQEVLLSKCQHVMLTTNLWTQAGLVNGSLGQVRDIVYLVGSKPPALPTYVTVTFNNSTGPPWDETDPKNIPIQPVTRGNHRQIPLAMAWAITIHKSQGLTLNKATINIGTTKRQGLTFTAISRVKSISGLRIEPTFSFDHYSKMKKNPYNIIGKKEEARLHLLSQQHA